MTPEEHAIAHQERVSDLADVTARLVEDYTRSAYIAARATGSAEAHAIKQSCITTIVAAKALLAASETLLAKLCLGPER